ncbi:hypothetical protein LO80_03450 [Candidatus Francisella endociliophora]|uniref:Uncharacterized protein n=1 Tax=Candidatus Francisella endociliophora TaxID=653937 RepID=A0A097ENH6_9GAMM|nr:hypothetical protein LO80_03450 [Francisella sp. FSC1006]
MIFISESSLVKKIKEWLVTQNSWWECGYFDHKLGNYYCRILYIDEIFIATTEFQAVYKAGEHIWGKDNERK